MLMAASARNFSIVFHDIEVQREMLNDLAPYFDRWYELCQLEETEAQPGGTPAQAALARNARLEAVFEGFRKESVFTDCYAALTRRCYWEEGKYELRMVVLTSEPTLKVKEKWSFTLNEGEVKQLGLNTITVMRQVCQLSLDWQYHFAYPTISRLEAAIGASEPGQRGAAGR